MLLAMGSRLPVNFRCTAIAGRHRLPMVKLFLVIVFLSGIPLGSLSAGDNTNSPAVAAKPAETGKSAAVDPEHGPRFARGLKTFKEHVRAVLTQECLMCHGGDTVESGFNLSTREAMLKGGVNGPAIKPGAGSESLLIKLVTHSAEPAMPLDASKLAPEVVTHLKQWIDDGAPYDRPLIDEASTDRTPWTEREIVDDAKTYWAFQPLQVIPPPIAAEDHWSRSGVDRFVWAKLKEQGLTPNGDADRQRLVRRLYFNLLGLPPTPAEVTAFLADDSPDAVEKLVDQLLD